MIAFIWAEDEKGAIGKDGKLPWHLPNDMKFFKAATWGNTVVMGRKTFESMGKRPLPHRTNIIMTRQEDYSASGVMVVHSPEELYQKVSKEENLFIIGGSEIYRLFLSDADVLWQTKINMNFDGDTFFPEIDWNEWELENEYEGMVDDQNRFPHTFRKFVRK